MKTEDIPEGHPSDWIPISDKAQLAALGKLAEEAAELSAIIARCIIQGVWGINPETGVQNIFDLRDEIADVRGLSTLVIRHYDMDDSYIGDRAERKRQFKQKWINSLGGKAEEFDHECIPGN